MLLSPRDRVDHLLLLKDPSPRQCLSAFATENGVNFVSMHPNIVNKASREMPELLQILGVIPPDLVAVHVANFLDGGLDSQSPNTLGPIGNLFAGEVD